MTGFVAGIGRFGVEGLTAVSNSASASYKLIQEKAPSRDIVILGLAVAALQILDGILTGIGVDRFGTSIEGNLFIRSLMEHFGHYEALFMVKSFALLVVASLCMLSHVVSWVPKAMKYIIVIYLAAAIIPWSALLLARA